MLVAAGCYAVSAAVCCVVASRGHAPFGDLHIYRSGGAAVRAGAPLYSLRFAWNLGFTYPPFAALVFTLLTIMPWAAAPAVVTVISVIPLPVTLWPPLPPPHRRAGTLVPPPPPPPP